MVTAEEWAQDEFLVLVKERITAIEEESPVPTAGREEQWRRCAFSVLTGLSRDPAWDPVFASELRVRGYLWRLAQPIYSF